MGRESWRSTHSRTRSLAVSPPWPVVERETGEDENRGPAGTVTLQLLVRPWWIHKSSSKTVAVPLPEKRRSIFSLAPLVRYGSATVNCCQKPTAGLRVTEVALR